MSERLSNQADFKNHSQNAEQARDLEPFKVRGHHLLPFKKLMRKNYYDKIITPEVLAKEMREDYSPGGLLSREAIQDTVGSTEQEGNQFGQALQDVFTKFIQLPDNYPIELSEGKKDTLCETCPIRGEHCSTKDLSVFGGTKNIVKYDGEEVDNFLQQVRMNNLEEKIVIDQELVYFSDSQPQMTRTIKTDALTFKAILQNWSY